MSASNFFRNFVTSSQMDTEKRSSHTTGEKDHPDDYPKKPKTQVMSSDDECNSTASSKTKICGETNYQDSNICDEKTEETVRQGDVIHLPVSECDGSFSVNQWLCKATPAQSVVKKEIELKEEQVCHIGEASNHDSKVTNASIGKAISILVSQVAADLALFNASKESNNAINHCIIKTEEPPMTENRFYNSDVTDRGGDLLLLRKTEDQEENETDVPSIKLESQVDHCSMKTTQECVLSSTKRTAIVNEQLQDNAGHVETNSHPLQSGNCKIGSPCVKMAPTRTTKAYPGSPLSHKNRRLVGELINLDYKSWNPAVSISIPAAVGELQTSHTVKTKSNQTQGKCYAEETVNGKQILVVSGIKLEDEVSSPASPQCSTTTQALSVSEVVNEHSSSSSSCLSVNDPSASSSFFSYVESMGSAELPPGSTLISDRGVFLTNNKRRPFACGYCGKSYTARGRAYDHIALQHDMNRRYSCRFCGKRFGLPYHLSGHVAAVHKRKGPFALNQRGKRSHANGGLVSTLVKFNNFKRSRDTKILSNQSQGEIYQTKTVNGTGFSVVSDIEYEDDVSALEDSQRSTAVQTWRLSETLNVDDEIPHDVVNSRGTTSSLCSEAESLLSSELLPPGSTMLTYYGVFRTKDEERPFMCGYCVTSFYSYPAACSHVEMQHGEKRYSCEFCDRRYAHQCHLALHRMTHTQQNIFACDLCDCRFRHQSQLRRHTLTHTKEQSFVEESRISHTKETKSNNRISKCLPSNSMNGKCISLAAGVVYEDDLSSSKSSQCSTTTETFLSEAAKEHPSSSSHQYVNIDDKSSSFPGPVGSTLSSNPPPGAVLLDYRHVFYTKGKEKPFSCGYCGKAYKTKHSAYGHVVHNHEEKRYSCEFCGKRYSQQCFLTSHLRIHTQEKPFACDQCGKQFRLEDGLRRHKYSHSEERLFPCKKCSKSFKTRDDLSRHSEIHEEDKERKVIVCNICKTRLKTSSSLKQHMTIHTGEKPFKCSVCDKQFSRNVVLQSHMNTHNGKKKPSKPCAVCGKTVTCNYMTTHMRMHAGEKPFECSICLKRFPKKQNLEGHIRSHTGEKPFACSGCDKRFALYSNMVTHKAKCTML